jgi:hypothetical protein
MNIGTIYFIRSLQKSRPISVTKFIGKYYQIVLKKQILENNFTMTLNNIKQLI